MTSPRSLQSSLWRLLKRSLTLSSYLGFLLGGIVMSWVVLPLVWCLGGSRSQRRRRCQSVLSASLRFFHWYMRLGGLLDFEPKRVPLREIAGSSESSQPGPVVMIANHPTLIDTTALLASVKHLCCISNPLFYRNPVLYPLLVCCGHIDAGKKSNIGSGLAVVETALERLKEGQSLLIFPEGTRSPSQGLGPFRRGAFEIALRAGVPIQPVLIEVSAPVLNHQNPWYWLPDQSVRYSVSAMPLVRTQKDTAHEHGSRKLCEEIRAEYAARLGLS